MLNSNNRKSSVFENTVFLEEQKTLFAQLKYYSVAGQRWCMPLVPALGRERQANLWAQGQLDLLIETLSQKTITVYNLHYNSLQCRPWMKAGLVESTYAVCSSQGLPGSHMTEHRWLQGSPGMEHRPRLPETCGDHKHLIFTSLITCCSCCLQMSLTVASFSKELLHDLAWGLHPNLRCSGQNLEDEGKDSG